MAQEYTRDAILKIVVDNTKALSSLAKYQEQIAMTKTAVNNLKSQQTEYKEALAQGAISQEEYNKLMSESQNELNKENAVLKSLNKGMRDIEYQMQKNIQANKEETGSLKSLRGQLSELTAQYDALSRVDREGEIGKELQSQIANVYNELKKAEEETGRFQRNVGNYGMKSVEAFKATAGAGRGVVDTLGNMKVGVQALKTASGWIGLLVGILSKVVQAISKNEVAMNAIRQAMAPLREIGVLVGKVFEKLGDIVANVSKKFTEFAKKLGFMKDAQNTEAELTAREIAFEKLRRDNNVKNAQAEADVAELRAKTAQKDKYTVKERLQFLEDAIALESEIAKRKKEQAEEEYQIALARSKQGANSKEDNDQLNALQVEAINARRDYNNKLRELNGQRAELLNQIASEEKKVSADTTDAVVKDTKKLEEQVDYRARILEEQMKRAEQDSYEYMLMQQQKLTDEYNAQMSQLEQQRGTEEMRRQLTMSYDAQMLQLEQDFYDAEDAMLTEYIDNTLAQLQAEADAEKEIDETRVQNKRATASAIGDAIGSVAQLMEAMSDNDKRLAKVAKVLALAQIAVKTGVATAEGIASASAVPFPANIAAIATTIGTIAGGMASAIASVKSAKFAKGGLVVGAGTGTSDSIHARLSNGESVMTAQTTSMFAPLLSSLNQIGGGNAIDTPSGASTEVLERAIARGMQSANIHVSVTEIDTVRERVDAIQSLASI